MAYNETYFVLLYRGVVAIWLSDLKQSTEYSLKQPRDSEKRCFDRYVAVQMSGLG